MPDLLIRDLPDDVVVAIDARARRLGLSRAEYLRRVLIRDARLSSGAVSVTDLKAVAERHRDLADEEVMRSAWP